LAHVASHFMLSKFYLHFTNNLFKNINSYHKLVKSGALLFKNILIHKLLIKKILIAFPSLSFPHGRVTQMLPLFPLSAEIIPAF